MSQHTRALTEFLAGLAYEQIPEPVLARTEDLFLDWLGSALASAGSHPIPLFERYAQSMGPADGPARILVNGQSSSAYFAALVNAASSHLVEQDDLHNSSVLHPATVVFPAALAAAQDLGKSGRELLVASVAGYEAGIRIGEFLGRSALGSNSRPAWCRLIFWLPKASALRPSPKVTTCMPSTRV